MKKICFITAFIITINALNAQIKKETERSYYSFNDFELGFTANIGGSNSKTKTTSTYNYDNQTYSYEEQQGNIFLQIGAMIGYYFFNGFSIEPEININITFFRISTALIGNICYTFQLSDKDIYPFFKLGYGISNYPDVGGYSDGLFGNMDYKTINAGFGLKLMYYEDLALRLELNYRTMQATTNSSYSDQFSSTSIKYETNVHAVSLSVGISLLL